MQKPFFILASLRDAAKRAIAFISSLLCKSKKQYGKQNTDPKENNNHPTGGVLTPESYQPVPIIVTEDTPFFPELNVPTGQLGNEEPSISPKATLPSDTSVKIPIEEKTEGEEKITETSTGNLEEKEQGSITESTAVGPIEDDPDVPVTEEATKKTAEDNGHGIKEPTKEKGSFTGPIGRRDKIPREPSGTESTYKMLKPELVCWRREGKWIIGIEIPADYFSEDIQEVRQGANEMLREESRDQCWRLESLTDPLEVTWGSENNRNIDQVLINAEPYGIFKLTGSDQAKGRLVKRISYGAYLLVVPSAWLFEKGMTDQDIVEESISIEKGKASWCRFEKGTDAGIEFVDENGKLWPFEAKSPIFELVGTTLEDANDNMGLLFGNAPPSVKIKSQRSWKEIACVVVIQQGIEAGEQRFKEKIIPLVDDTELSLGSNLQAQGSGWYLLRFYDNKQDSPIDTLDFRFVSAIDKIKIHQNSVLPERSGHQEVIVELEHKPNCSIKLTAPVNSSIVVKQEMNHTTVVIPPKQEADESSWFLSFENGPYVHATFLAERIWWCIIDDRTEPIEWQDKPVALRREDFKQNAHKALWIHFPTSGWTNRICVDFSLSQPRHFPVKIDQRVAKILLDNFYDSHTLCDKGVAHNLFIQVQKENKNFSAIVATLSAEKVHAEKPIQQPPQTIDARAACNGGRVFYGNCRNCRAMLKEKNYGPH